MVFLVLLAVGEKAALVQGVWGASTPLVEAKAGGVVAREGQAGAAFGTLRVGKGKPGLPFFAVLRHGLGGGGPSDSSEDVRVEDRAVTMKHVLTLDGKSLTLVYAAEVSADGTKLTRESLSVNGKAADLSKGRVLLIDLTAEPMHWEAKKVTLPAEVGPAKDAKAAEDVARSVLAEIIKQDAAARAFVQGR